LVIAPYFRLWSSKASLAFSEYDTQILKNADLRGKDILLWPGIVDFHDK